MRIFKRVLIIVGILLLAFVAFLALSVPADALRTRGNIEALVNTTIPGAEADVKAFVARPANTEGRLPAVIMIHEFWGMREEIAGKAAALAQEGYVVVAPDTYRGATTSWIPRAIWLALTTPDAQVHANLDAVIAWVQAQPDVDPGRIVVMGFCYGGGKALSYSLSPSAAAATLAGTGVFYGTLESDPAVLARLPGPVLGIFGALDTRPSPADVAGFKAGLKRAGIEHEVTIYEGVGHAFVQSMAQIASDPTQAAAWAQFTTWLARVTQPKTALAAPAHAGSAS